MNILGIGALELTLILVIGLMLVGPVGMVRWARKAGALVRQFRNSELWQSVQGSRRAMDKVGREILGDTAAELNSIRNELSKINLTAGSDREIFESVQDVKAGLTKTLPSGSNGSSGKPVADPIPKVPQIGSEQKS